MTNLCYQCEFARGSHEAIMLGRKFGSVGNFWVCDKLTDLKGLSMFVIVASEYSCPYFIDRNSDSLSHT